MISNYRIYINTMAGSVFYLLHKPGSFVNNYLAMLILVTASYYGQY